MIDPGEGRYVVTIGHSNHPIAYFLGLLNQHGVEVVADTRSQPYSKYSPQYDSEGLKKTLVENRVKYIYVGNELGGRPKGAGFYDPDGHVLYGRVAESARFLAGLQRLERSLSESKVALLCSEESPGACHRRLLIGRVLAERGVAVHHILGDGRLQSEEDFAREEAEQGSHNQLTLFDYESAPEWKSIPSVLRKKRQNSSSDY